MESKALAKGVESHKLVFFPGLVDTSVIFPKIRSEPVAPVNWGYRRIRVSRLFFRNAQRKGRR